MLSQGGLITILLTLQVAQNYTARGYDDFAVVVQPFTSGITAENLTIDFLSDVSQLYISAYFSNLPHTDLASVPGSLLKNGGRKELGNIHGKSCCLLVCHDSCDIRRTLSIW